MNETNRPFEPEITPLAQALPASRFGHKAANLAHLMKNGFAVPEGFAIPAGTLQQWLEDTGLGAALEQLLAQVEYQNLLTVQEASEKIRKLVEETSLPAELLAALGHSLARVLDHHSESVLDQGIAHGPVHSLDHHPDLAPGPDRSTCSGPDPFYDRNLAHAPVPECAPGPRSGRAPDYRIEHPITCDLDYAPDPNPGPMPALRLIVRSSAVGEDSVDASFAGQLDSWVCETNLDQLTAALKKCWSSLWGARSLLYQRQKGVFLKEMGVVVQELVEPDFAGVLFTRAPHLPNLLHSAPEAELMIEYVPGQGESLVSGRENPGRVRVARETLQIEVEALPETPETLVTVKPPETQGAPNALEATSPSKTESRKAMSRKAENRKPRELSPKIIRELARRGLEIEALMGTPQDIEWCLGPDKKLWVVQARPIVQARPNSETLSNTQSRSNVRAEGVAQIRPAVQTGAAPEPDVLWSNVNVNENYPDPITPFLYSLALRSYAHYFRDLGQAFGVSKKRLAARHDDFQHIIGTQAGRMYYNLTSIYNVIGTLPFGKQVAGYFDAFVGVPEKDDASKNHKNRFCTTINWSSGLTLIAEVLMIVLTTTISLWRAVARVETFERIVEDYLESCANRRKNRAASPSKSTLYQEYTGFLNIRFFLWKFASIADAAAMFSYGLFNTFLRRVLRGKFREGMINSLLMGIPGIVSAAPAQEIWNITSRIRQNPDIKQAFDSLPAPELLAKLVSDPAFKEVHEHMQRYVQDWGFRCSGELMLSTPHVSENPIALLQVVKGYLAAPSRSPQEIAEKQQQERWQIEAEIRHSICPWGSFQAFHPLVRLFGGFEQWTHTSVALRERVRLKQAKLYGQCRKTLLEIGLQLTAEGMFESRDDIFFLKYDELEQLLSGHEMIPAAVPELIRTRKREMAAITAVVPPDTLRLKWGEYWAGYPTHSPKTSQIQQFPNTTQTLHLQGISACAGIVTAPARVLADVTQAHELRPGEILVTRQTDPGWGLIFPLIAGLVLERGGLLSHGAIIAREFGIPAVVGIKNATSLIAHNQRITLNGTAGTVEIHR